MLIEPVGEGDDVGLKLVEAMGQFVAAVELVTPGGLGTLDAGGADVVRHLSNVVDWLTSLCFGLEAE